MASSRSDSVKEAGRVAGNSNKTVQVAHYEASDRDKTVLQADRRASVGPASEQFWRPSAGPAASHGGKAQMMELGRWPAMACHAGRGWAGCPSYAGRGWAGCPTYAGRGLAGHCVHGGSGLAGCAICGLEGRVGLAAALASGSGLAGPETTQTSSLA